jgi:hypothetical protein
MRFGKTPSTIGDSFYRKVPRTFQSLTDIPFPCTQAPGNNPILTSIPSRRRVGSPTAMAGRSWPTNGAGPPCGSPKGDWRGWPARARLRLGHAAVVGGGGRGGLRLRRGRRNAGQRATAQASTDPRGEFRTVGKHWGKAEVKVHRAAGNGRRLSTARARGARLLNRALGRR